MKNLDVDLHHRLGKMTLEAKFACETGGITAIFGRSGAGKTSLVNMLAGLLKPDRGRISLGGETLFDSAAGIDVPIERRRLGYVFQEGRLFPHLSVRNNLTYGLKRVPKGERRIELEQVVALLDIESLLERRPQALSGGEKQRVALGRALLANPKLLLMDEPLAALDQPRKDEILPFIEQLRDEMALPIIYVSHSMQEIVRLADTLVLMSSGRVEAVGSVEDLTSRLDLRPLTGRYEAGAVLATAIAGQDKAFGLTELRFAGGRLKVPHLNLPLGQGLRVRIRARDVSIALTPPRDTSILNMIECEVKAISEERSPQVDLQLDAGGAAIWARITARSCQALGLRPGLKVFALIKSVAIDRQSLGRRDQAARFLSEDE
ncbi:molybdenum ABC transporter ATP-binding protein [Pelagibius litoralis]|uniref:Molybdenum ABC transporter ATP-binding protein n=1 Tax=Pelagibius litoralis TaxID=374515 RepID=A0A967C600_9PROT|nr:molybdenum ABC transporter ATP-binding protein [Pelagibius litoralis]NIA67182.1 molybdenum ABC transporter ATP-binding protein [Pelagibius litoralis]